MGGSTSLHWHNANVNDVINVGLKNNIKFIFVASSSVSAHPAIIGVFGDILISVEQDNYVSVGGSEPEYSGFLLWVYNEGDNIYIKNKSTSVGSARWSVVY